MRQCVWSFPTLRAEWIAPAFLLWKRRYGLAVMFHKILLYNTVKKNCGTALLENFDWLNWKLSASITVFIIIIIIVLSYFSGYFKLIFAPRDRFLTFTSWCTSALFFTPPALSLHQLHRTSWFWCSFHNLSAFLRWQRVGCSQEARLETEWY